MKRILSIVFVSAIAGFCSCKQATNADNLINVKASLPDSFKFTELNQKVITSFINKNTHTTSILYGNDKAVAAAKAGQPTNATGASFTLVTWRQQDDKHWFGARIPGELISAEKLTITESNAEPSYQYQKYSGKELVKLADTTGSEARVKFILAQRASIIP